ncbi:MAG: FeoA family protein [Vicinamibacterales bacterium]
MIRLSDLPNDRPAEVVGPDEHRRGFARRWLMDSGFTEGALIAVPEDVRGDPRAWGQVRGTLIALRRDQASQVLVWPVDAPGRAAGREGRPS